MKFRNIIITFFFCTISVACINPSTKQNTGLILIPTKSSDATEYLNFSERYSNLSLEAQKQELATTIQILAINPNDLFQRMKLVMIYGLPSSNLLDNAKAQGLLQQLLQEDTLSNTQLAFAHLLFDHLIAINKLSKSNRDDQKRIEIIQQKNDALQLKLEAAQQQIDELKNIEKSMGAREIFRRK